MMGNNDEALRVLLLEGDPDLEQTAFADVADPSSSDDAEHVVTQEPAVLFDIKWVRMLYNFLPAVL